MSSNSESKLTKLSVGYMHAPRGDYDCDDCPFWIEMSRRCVLHGPNDIMLPEDSCNYFVLGFPGTFGSMPKSYVTKAQSGYISTSQGLSCKRCASFNRDEWKCSLVDADSPGDDTGMIHPDACCDQWTPDPTYGSMPEEALVAIQV